MGGIGALITAWAFFRMPESLKPEDRRPFTLSSIGRAIGIVLTNRFSLYYTLASTFVFGALFAFINSAQQIYVGIYGLGVWFPLLFAIVASFMALSSYMNSRLVVRFGMRPLSHFALTGFLVVSAIWMIWSFFGVVPLVPFVILFSLAMFQFGWIGSNFNSIAMEPLGHIAGSASAVQGFIQTLGGGLTGALIGQAYDGTTTPLAIGFVSLALISLVLVAIAERGRLYQGAPQRTQP
jgi:DHA1 family bicyclomycin/chloramphenicol resistance-like MFS transporter